MNSDTQDALNQLKKAYAMVLIAELKKKGVTKEDAGFLRLPVDISDPETITFHFDYMTRKGRQVRESLHINREEAELGKEYCYGRMIHVLRIFIDRVLELYG